MRSTFVGSAFIRVFSSPPQRPMTSDVDAFLDLGLNPELPALEASTLPLAIEEAVHI